jgi:hypothetical protein
VFPASDGIHGRAPCSERVSKDYPCPHCESNNDGEAYFCRSCRRKLTIAQLISRGTGIVPKGFSWELKCRDSTLGRGLHNDFVIPTPNLSAVHVRFVYCVDCFFAHTDNPTGDVTVDDEPLILPIILQEGSTLAVGGELFDIAYF